MLDEILTRIDRRLAKLKMSETAASIAAGKSESLIRDMRRGVTGKNGVKGAKVDSLTALAPVLKTSVGWLAAGEGMEEIDDNPAIVTAIPVISWVQAGLPNLAEIIADAPRIYLANMPDGEWFALRVEGDSMDRISPPGSIIIINRKQRLLAANACFVFTDENGAGTYKRYRPAPPRLEPVSTNLTHEPIFLSGQSDPRVVGRVRFSLLEM